MAKKYWRPRAGAIPHIVTITFGGVPVKGNTVTVTINDSSLTMTVGTLVSTGDVAQAFQRAWHAQNSTDNPVEDETRNVGGNQLLEFTRISAKWESDTVVLTGLDLGVPFTVGTSKTGAVTIASAVTQAATGPNHVDNPANWSGGALPAAADTIIFDQGNVHALYGLTYFRTNTIDLAVLITGDYTGNIGLPWWNPFGWQEYNPRFFQLYDTLGLRSLDVVPGQNGGSGGGNQILRFEAQSQTWDELRVTGTRAAGSRIEVHGGSVDLLSVSDGGFSIDPDDAEQTTGMVLDKLIVGHAAAGNNANVVIGRLATWSGADSAVDLLGGNLDILNVLDPGVAEATPVTISGGRMRVLSDGDVLNVTVQGGVLEWSGLGTHNGTIDVWGPGTLDMSGDGRLKTFSGTINGYRGATFALGRQLPTITPVGCFTEDLNITR